MLYVRHAIDCLPHTLPDCMHSMVQARQRAEQEAAQRAAEEAADAEVRAREAAQLRKRQEEARKVCLHTQRVGLFPWYKHTRMMVNDCMLGLCFDKVPFVLRNMDLAKSMCTWLCSL
jgi:hypothetical protein